MTGRVGAEVTRPASRQIISGQSVCSGQTEGKVSLIQACSLKVKKLINHNLQLQSLFLSTSIKAARLGVSELLLLPE